MALPEGSMKFFLGDALRQYTQDFRLLTDENPYRFMLNGRRFSAHVSEIHFAARLNPNEWRIQVPAGARGTQRERSRQGDTIVFLGFFPDGRVFSAWEPEYVLSLASQDVGSVYVPKDHWTNAARSTVEIDIRRANNLGRLTTKISMPAELLGFYLENWPSLHTASNADELRRAIAGLLNNLSAPSFAGRIEEQVNIGGERRRITATRTAFARDPRFRDAVMQAYAGRCCLCGRQLGMVQAAHIVPHSHPDSVDHVSNGLALCVEHHRMYDDALLLPTSDRRLHLNLDRVEHLENTGQGAGLDEVTALSAKQYMVPDNAASRPKNNFLEQGVRIRLGKHA